MKNNNFLKFALVNKELVPFEKANISIATQALHYGTAAFGGMRVKVTTSGKKKSAIIFRLDEHCKRLVNSAKMLNCDPEI
ncbi:MAG: hypothetical protein ORN26_02120 [Candidatus Pacebacteria bacterium]|nr:hypothetical protein [Candidatus Paceibacterota bacterium]